ncbi:MAG: hypothetical protein H0W71_03060 [Sphingomonas sp.]|nr:hypothetical protein [Sphingomonas sp.]
MTISPLKLRPNRAYNALDAGLGIVTDDRRNIDQYARLVSTRPFAKPLAMPP